MGYPRLGMALTGMGAGLLGVLVFSRLFVDAAACGVGAVAYRLF